jgi:hypothetical protein
MAFASTEISAPSWRSSRPRRTMRRGSFESTGSELMRRDAGTVPRRNSADSTIPSATAAALSAHCRKPTAKRRKYALSTERSCMDAPRQARLPRRPMPTHSWISWIARPVIVAVSALLRTARLPALRRLVGTCGRSRSWALERETRPANSRAREHPRRGCQSGEHITDAGHHSGARARNFGNFAASAKHG